MSAVPLPSTPARAAWPRRVLPRLLLLAAACLLLAGFTHSRTRELADPAGAKALGDRARARVIARYGWDARLAPLDALVWPETAVAA